MGSLEAIMLKFVH